MELHENIKVISELLGHKSISITLDIYSHVSDDLKKEATLKIDHLFNQIYPDSIKENASVLYSAQ
jgi:integrase